MSDPIVTISLSKRHQTFSSFEDSSFWTVPGDHSIHIHVDPTKDKDILRVVYVLMCFEQGNARIMSSMASEAKDGTTIQLSDIKRMLIDSILQKIIESNNYQ